MIRCAAARWWLWYVRGFAGFAVAGGVIALVAVVVVAVTSRPGALPLLVIGLAWAGIGTVNWLASMRLACELRLESGQVFFRRPAGEVPVPAAEILVVRYPRLDPNRMRCLLFKTAAHGTIKAAPRMDGLAGFLAALREQNPRLDIRL
jgi:hypothetical protein